MAEFAIVMPLLLLLFMALIDFGRVVYAQHTIAEAAREAARVAMVTPADTQSKFDAIRAAVFTPGVAVGPSQIVGAPGACTSFASSGNTYDDTTSPATCFYPDGTRSDGRVVVRISATVTLLTPIISSIVGGSFTVQAQSIVYIQ